MNEEEITYEKNENKRMQKKRMCSRRRRRNKRRQCVDRGYYCIMLHQSCLPLPYLVPLGIGLCSRVPHNLILDYKLLTRYSTNTAIHTITQINTGDELHAVVTMVGLHKKNRYINR